MIHVGFSLPSLAGAFWGKSTRPRGRRQVLRACIASRSWLMLGFVIRCWRKEAELDIGTWSSRLWATSHRHPSLQIASCHTRVMHQSFSNARGNMNRKLTNTCRANKLGQCPNNGAKDSVDFDPGLRPCQVHLHRPRTTKRHTRGLQTDTNRFSMVYTWATAYSNQQFLSQKSWYTPRLRCHHHPRLLLNQDTEATWA